MFRRSPPPPFPPGVLPAGALLVGGAARDWLRGVPAHDFDWAVPDPAGAAAGLAAALGGSAFALDPERGYWRVTVPGRAGTEAAQHDLVPLSADVTADLLRRDFTVNALGVRADGRVLDPTGGVHDLRARRLRMVSPENLRADPLRAWRAARFETTLGFRLEPATEAAVRAVAADLAGGRLPLPAAERVRDEVQALLRSPEAARGALRLEELGLLALTVPELRAGLGVTQGGFHHLDVFHHGAEALHQLLARFPDAPLPLRWAAWLHDVGKPGTQARDPHTGRATFHGHDRLGAELSTQILTRLKLPGDEVRRVSALVEAHMLPLPATEREARRFVHRRRDLLPDLLALMLADREAARGPHSSEASRQAYARGIERVLAALEAQPMPSAPLLGGQEIMALLDTGPGPAVGEAVRALAEAAALGEVGTPDQARAFVQAWAARRGLPGAGSQDDPSR